MAHLRRFAPALIIAVLYLVPMLNFNEYFLTVLVTSMTFMISAIGLNLISGYAGQISFGHAALAGIGAYTSALLCTKMQWSPWLAIPAAVVMAALFGLVIGLPSLKLSGHFLALTTIGFGMIIQVVLSQWQDLTGGINGVFGVPYLQIGDLVFDNPNKQYFLMLTVVLLCIWVSHNLVKGRFGAALRAIRQDPLAAGVMGINVMSHKLQAFVISAAFGGLSGALYAHLTAFVNPEKFGLALSIRLVLMLVMGGMGSLLGGILGPLTLDVVYELLREYQEYQMMIYAVTIVLICHFMPGGLAGLITSLRGRFFVKPTAEGGEPRDRTKSLAG